MIAAYYPRYPLCTSVVATCVFPHLQWWIRACYGYLDMERSDLWRVDPHPTRRLNAPNGERGNGMGGEREGKEERKISVMTLHIEALTIYASGRVNLLKGARVFVCSMYVVTIEGRYSGVLCQAWRRVAMRLAAFNMATTWRGNTCPQRRWRIGALWCEPYCI